MTRWTRQRDQQGFTLVEMLVAAVVLLLVLSVANALFFESVVSWRSGEARMDVREGLRLGLDRMSRELRTAQRVTDMQSDSIKFVVMQDDGSELTVRYYVNLSKELVRGTPGNMVLATGVDALQLQYYHKIPADTTSPVTRVTMTLEGSTGNPSVSLTVDTSVSLRTSQ